VEHPGGEQILLAAGSSVEPFWMLYAVHNNTLMSSTYWKIYESVRTVSKNKSVNSVFGV
jgi:sulfite oxidase